MSWAIRLIQALRAKLVADLQAVENGQPPRPPVEPPSFAVGPEPARSDEPHSLADRVERPERAERPERLERERFGFERRGTERHLAEILKRPTEEVIALICRELGLPDDWPRLAEAAWAREEMERGEVAPLQNSHHPDESRDPGFLRPRTDGTGSDRANSAAKAPGSRLSSG